MQITRLSFLFTAGERNPFMTKYPEFAKLLNRYMEERERSASWLAKKLGIHASTVGRWRQGETLPKGQGTVDAILDVLEIKDGQQRNELLVAACQGTIIDDETYLPHQSRNDSGTIADSFLDFATYDDNYWVGRDDLVRTLCNHIQANCRLLLLSGMAGIGKTALAERIALELLPWLSTREPVLRLNFDSQNLGTEFVNVALKWLKSLGKEIEPEKQNSPDILLDSLMTTLSSQCCLIIVDALEKAMLSYENKQENQFVDEWWGQFFHALLATEGVLSRVIITTQELPDQIVRVGSQYVRRFRHESVNGLNKAEQEEFFQKAGFVHSEDNSDHHYLSRIGQAYAGHPLALRTIMGEIKGDFGGNVPAYWNEYGHEIELVEKNMTAALELGQTQAVDNWRLDRFSIELQRQVRHRLDRTFERLQQQKGDAYLLICTAAIYRCPVKERLWLDQLAWRDICNQRQQDALRTLYERSLVERQNDDNGKRLVGLHSLIRSIALEHHERLFSNRM